MDFKLVMLSVACFAFLMQPADSALNVARTAIGAIGDIASIGKKIVRTKSAAAVRGGTDIASIMATSLGLKLRALAQASATMQGAGADAFIDLGDAIQRAGDRLVGNKLANSNLSTGTTSILVERPVVEEVIENVKVKTPAAVVEDVPVPCERKVVEVPVESIPLRTVQLRVRRPETVVESSARLPFIGNKVSSVWNLLRNAAYNKINNVASIFSLGGPRTVEQPFVYEIVETPRLFQAPTIEAFQIKKK